MEGGTISAETPLEEVETLARRKLTKRAWDMLGSAETGSSYQRNLEFFGRILLRQRVFHGISNADTSLELFGRKTATPILVAPIGSLSEIGNDAELQVIMGTAKAQSMLFVSYVYKMSMEQVSKSASLPLVWQAYMQRGYDDVKMKIKLAESLGFAAVGATVDAVQPVKIGDSFLPGRVSPHTFSLDDIERLRKETSLPFFVKGIMNGEDAKAACDAGADAIVVSNHGGRIADYSRATIEVLPEVKKAVGSKVTIMIDGGFRRGTDVLKALALGAKAVLIGRPIYWSVAAAGSEGVSTVITKLTEELRRSMIICGIQSLEKVDEHILIRQEQKDLATEDK